MNKEDQENKKENKEGKENSEIINKLYVHKNISEKETSKTEYTGATKLNQDDDSEKYIKEMHDLSDKNDFKNNIIVSVLVIVVVAIILFSILMNTPLMKSKTDVVTKTAVNKSSTAIIPAKTKTEAKVIKPIATQAKIYKYLGVEANRTSVLKKAVKLNGGNRKGVNVYLLSEILRSNTVAVPAKTTTVKQLSNALISIGWKKDTRFNQLKPGDICFTTDMPGKTGSPSHAYIFMSWVKNGKTDYANICDGQLDEFSNIIHKRNLSVTTTTKDKFSYYLRK